MKPTLIPALRHLLTASGTFDLGGSIRDINPIKHSPSSGKFSYIQQHIHIPMCMYKDLNVAMILIILCIKHPFKTIQTGLVLSDPFQSLQSETILLVQCETIRYNFKAVTVTFSSCKLSG